MSHGEAGDPRQDLRDAAASGLMALTGRPDGPPLYVGGLAGGLRAVADEVAHWSAQAGDAVAVDWAELVTMRAVLLDLRRRGHVSANGTCRLLRGRDGWMALSLARPEDGAAVGAIVEGSTEGDPWQAVQRRLASAAVSEVVGRARLLGVPAAPLGRPALGAARWTARRMWPPAGPRDIGDLRIVDLSSMWAGPLAAKLLGQAGGCVHKVESTSRPDGSRAVPAFYRALHGDAQPLCTFDFASAQGRRRLRALLESADVVIESSRPRALEQLGSAPESLEARAGRVWVSITGYGRRPPGRDWVAFGDDAAVAGGLVAWEDDESPVFCGDALADPVTGMVAAAAALESIVAGGGVLLEVSMAACAASMAPTGAGPATAASRDAAGWYVEAGGARVPVPDQPPARAASTRSASSARHTNKSGNHGSARL